MGEVYIQVGINNIVLALLIFIFLPSSCFGIISLKVSLSGCSL